MRRGAYEKCADLSTSCSSVSNNNKNNDVDDNYLMLIVLHFKLANGENGNENRARGSPKKQKKQKRN